MQPLYPPASHIDVEHPVDDPRPDDPAPQRFCLTLPLQPGTWALRRLLMVTPFPLLFGGLVVLFTKASVPLPPFTVGILLFFGALIGYGYGLEAYKLLATDLELREDELIIRGGSRNVQTIPYSEIVPGTLAIVQSVDNTDPMGSWTVHDLCLGLRTGDSVLLARVGDRDDDLLVVEELKAVVDILLQPGRRPPRREDTELLICDGCGSPGVPTDELTVPCKFCSDTIYVPERIRLKISQQRELSRVESKTTRRIQRLLKFPRATGVNRLIYAFHAAIFVGSCWSMWWLIHRRYAFVFAAFFLVHTCYQLLRFITARRIAFRALAFLGKSRRVVGDRTYDACRNCGGLLPACDESAVLTRCVYCEQTNLLGVDLPAFAAEMANTRFRLEGVLSTVRDSYRRCWARLAQLAIALALTASFIIWW